MASTIITKNSSTASAVPVVGDLTKGELAVNVTDKKIYTKDNSAAVVKLVGSLGNQEANAVAITGGSIAGITDLAVADGGTGASTASDARTNLGLGTIATQAASSVTITGGSVTGITDITVADGGTGASTAANARTNLGAAASGANSDITSLSGLTTALSVAQGGTGITSFGSGVATFLGTPSSANLLAAVTDETGTGALVFANTPTLVAPILGTPTSGNFSSGSFTWPTFNQNTTGTAAGLSATLAIASGGTGATTAGGALTSLGAYAASNPSGYTTNTGTVTSVGGTGTVNGLTLTGTVTTSGNLTLGGTLSGVSLTSQVSGTLPTANGGTNLTSFTSGGVVYASSTSALATGSALTFNGTSLGIGSSSYGDAGTITASIGVAGTTSGGLQLFASSAQEHFIQWGDATSGSGTYAGAIGYSHASDYMRFYVASAEQMRLTGTGLGIGTSNPQRKIDAQSTTADYQLRLGYNSSFYYDIGRVNSNGYLGFYGSQTGATGFTFGGVDGTRMTLDSAGNLGLGVTPSAWNTIKPIEIARAGSFVGANSSGSTYLGANTRFASGWIYANTGASGLYTVEDNTHFWRIAPSGTAGNAISFTQAMTLDASGNLLVGGTSNAVGARAILENAAGNQLGLRYSSVATYYNSVDSSGNLIWTKDGTERARIDSSGNLLIGTTSRPSSAKLTVAGGLSVNNNTDNATSNNNYGNFFAKNAGSVSPSTTTTIKNATGSEAAMYLVSGVNSGLGIRFFDVVVTLTASVTPVVISTGSINAPPARTYSMSGENLQVNFGGADSFVIYVTGMGSNEA